MRDITFSRTSYRRFEEKILDSAGTHKRVVGQFCFTNCSPRRMEGKFQNVSTIFLKLSEELRPYGFAAYQLMRFQ